MTEEWKPTTDQINGVISSSCEFIKDEANDLLEELQCPSGYISGILNSIASDFESKEKKDAWNRRGSTIPSGQIQEYRFSWQG